MSNNESIHVVGAGLAGSECAFQLAELGHKVVLYEMRGATQTPAHKTGKFAELVCSNSLGSQTDYSAPGQLKWEASQLGCLVLEKATQSEVPAGMSLSVDREIFADLISTAIKNHPNIEIRNEVVESVDQLPRPAVIATGPLTHSKLADSLQKHFDYEFLYFYDAIAPVIDADTINYDKVFKADRWNKGTSDYLNCPFTKEEYFQFIESINSADVVETKEFETTPYFDGCMPVEAIVERGPLTLKCGPMSSNGIFEPVTRDRPFAVVQLRQENREATAYNMVGFQTKMKYGEQKRVFRMIPGLENAEFLKLGSIHRNLYIRSPRKLAPNLSSLKDPNLFFAGQITGVEGYFESTCVGLMVARMLDQKIKGLPMRPPPRETALGSLLNAITEDMGHFQPKNINFSLMPQPKKLEGLRGRKFRRDRRDLQIEVAKRSLEAWLNPVSLTEQGPVHHQKL